MRRHRCWRWRCWRYGAPPPRRWLWPNAFKPRYVIPIHDWYLEERGKRWLYGMAELALAEEGITLFQLDDFETVSVEID